MLINFERARIKENIGYSRESEKNIFAHSSNASRAMLRYVTG